MTPSQSEYLLHHFQHSTKNMMKYLSISLFLLSTFAFAQTPLDAPLPEKFADLEPMITVDHFPSPVLASTDPNEPGTYFWKHTTTVFSPSSNIQIEEGGAYIFYNNQWNLRVSYTSKEFSKFFNIPKAMMKAGEPYSFVENWRRDTRLYGGWAMWYVIGKTEDGKRVYGIGKLDTVGELYE